MADKVQDLEDIDILLYALHTIATGSEEADTTRVAMIALYETGRGRAFLQANPIQV